MNGGAGAIQSDETLTPQTGYDVAPHEPHFLEPWFWGFCIFLLTSPFTFHLTGADPGKEVALDLTTMRRPEGAGAALYGLRYFVALLALPLILPHWRLAASRLPRLWPVLLFVLWATLSLLWTESVKSTQNGVGAILPLIITGFCLALRLPSHIFARSMVYSGLFMGIFSVLWALFLPHFGVHQQDDIHQAVHAGAWRGIYMHKNTLGAIAATYAVLAIMAGRAVVPSPIIKFSMVALMIFIILRTTSATALILVLIIPPMILFLIALNANRKAILLLILIPAFVIGLTGINIVMSAMGRDLTFTGRTDIWDVALEAAAAHPILGYGYASISYGGFALAMYRRAGLLDPHNGYLDLLLSIGSIGLLIFMGFAVAMVSTARAMYVVGGEARQSALVVVGVTICWLIASLSESQDRPLGALAALGFCAAGLLVYRPSRTASLPG